VVSLDIKCRGMKKRRPNPNVCTNVAVQSWVRYAMTCTAGEDSGLCLIVKRQLLWAEHTPDRRTNSLATAMDKTIYVQFTMFLRLRKMKHSSIWKGRCIRSDRNEEELEWLGGSCDLQLMGDTLKKPLTKGIDLLHHRDRESR
jgi:hypothetical protein